MGLPCKQLEVFEQVFSIFRNINTMCSLAATSSSLIFLIFSISFSEAAIGISTGACPDVRGMTDFDSAAYLGQWYEYSNMFEIYQDVFAVGAKCVRATYTDQGETVGVKNEYVSPLTGYGSIEGSARFASSASMGELIVNFNNPAGRSLFGGADPNTPNYSVIDTDYTSYPVVYMCRPIAGIFKKESLWLLTRDAVPSDSTVETALEVMRTNNLPLEKLSKTSQTGCEALP